MKVTFPHMGNIYLPLKGLFDDFGIHTVIPPKCSKKTLELGMKYSPEFICLPFKLNLGNFLESCEKGADTIILPGGCGPCRLGYYAEVQKEILKDLGINADMVILEAPDANFKEFYDKLSKIINTKNIFKLIKYFKEAITLLKKLNELEEFVLITRPYEINKNDINNIYDQLIFELENTMGSRKMIEHVDEALSLMKNVPIDLSKEVLRVGVVGEIYTVLEDFTNLSIVEKLNDMGVEVHKSLSSGEWLIENIFYRLVGKSKEFNVREAAKPYVSTFIGGHGRETIGNTVLYDRKGFDGVIHLMPFSCMPEIVALSILPKLQQEKNIPILSLTIDEMTGQAGYMTRIEAYIDLLKSRKEKALNQKIPSFM